MKTLILFELVTSSEYRHSGGGSACHQIHNTHSSNRGGVQRYAYVHGSEYEYTIVGTHDHNVPCTVCMTKTRETVMMIPAKTECPTSSTMEHKGYLMTERVSHKRSTYECVDYNQESIPGSHLSVNGALCRT